VNFVSWAFVALFAIVLAARRTIGRRKIEPAYVFLLILASATFYAWHIPVYIGILVLSSVIDYWAGLWLARLGPETAGRRRAVLALSLTTNLGLLAFFKYANFFLGVARDVLGPGAADVLPLELGLALPMGISFYTFQSMSYTIDVYRGVLAPIHRSGPSSCSSASSRSWWPAPSCARPSSCRRCRAHGACAARSSTKASGSSSRASS
jgi:alginate O-acetyltransferase complex protein AlgI